MLDGDGRDAVLHDDRLKDISAVSSGRGREAFRGVLRIPRRVWTRGQTQIPHLMFFFSISSHEKQVDRWLMFEEGTEVCGA